MRGRTQRPYVWMQGRCLRRGACVRPARNERYKWFARQRFRHLLYLRLENHLLEIASGKLIVCNISMIGRSGGDRSKWHSGVVKRIAARASRASRAIKATRARGN